MLVFLARDAEQRVLTYARAGIPKAERAEEIIRFLEFWRRQAGTYPQEVVFDSQLTTYSKLRQLDELAVRFITLRRRSRKMLAEIYGSPPGAWKRVRLPALTRTYRTPKVLDQEIDVKGYGQRIRQLSVIDLGHEEPTVVLTNDRQRSPVAAITRYAQRMLIENGIAEAIGFFHLDALSSMVGIEVDFDLQVTLMASSLYRLLSDRLGDPYQRATAKTIFRNLLDVGGKVEIDHGEVRVTLDKRAHNPILVASGLADSPTPMPWAGHENLVIRFA